MLDKGLDKTQGRQENEIMSDDPAKTCNNCVYHPACKTRIDAEREIGFYITDPADSLIGALKEIIPGGKEEVGKFEEELKDQVGETLFSTLPNYCGLFKWVEGRGTNEK